MNLGLLYPNILLQKRGKSGKRIMSGSYKKESDAKKKVFTMRSPEKRVGAGNLYKSYLKKAANGYIVRFNWIYWSRV